MAFTVVELEYLVPPAVAAIFAVPIGTVDQALDLWKWASEDPEFSATLTTKLNGDQIIQVEGRTASTVSSMIGGDKWIVFDSGKLIVFETSAEALAIYKVKGT